jgi:uncharacterized membrane protein
MHLLFLLWVTLTPFCTALLASFLTYRLAVVVYWCDVFLLGTTLYWSWSYALATKLVTANVTPEASEAVKKRIVIAQTLYGLSTLLCLVNTYLAIGCIFALQINYALGLRWPGKLNH